MVNDVISIFVEQMVREDPVFSVFLENLQQRRNLAFNEADLITSNKSFAIGDSQMKIIWDGTL